ncbi:MAG: BMP family ABC transporter substrate-binding protein [Spirochaetia bacterium]|nr:BMP family ABC transporter substrate-binding protein [Spirochaetia bacterium]MDD7268433.1 BMP family ABC transporter substrate-binding protein [Treponema sp.]MDY4985893.1 BMP family ABC transporter substrate-binding protein [Treponema sp.]
MKKSLVAVVATAVLVGALFSGCSKKESSGASFKVGVIYIGDENEGYTEAHMKGIQEMKKSLGLTDAQVIEKKCIPEDEKAYDAAIDLAEQGCKYIIGTSFGHESYLIQVAKEYPDIVFAHATGYQAGLSGLKNMHNFMPSVYQSRYVSGVVAGLKLNDMIASGKITAAQAKIGYVGAYPYAEVVSGYTSFFLGVRSVCPSATMEVRYTNSWADMTLEKETAEALIAAKCVLISQHADTTGAPTACEARGVPCVGYNVDMIAVAPNAALTSAALNWGAFYTMSAKAVMAGESFDVDWSKGYSDGAVYTTAINSKVATADAQAKVDAVVNGIINGSVKVFDTATFTVGGKSIETLIAEGGDFAKYAAYVKDGAFNEQNGFAAPAFDLRIDGIVER